jgi:predicted ester cyclase
MTNTDLIARLVACWNGKLEDIDNVLSPKFIHHETGIEGGGTTGRDEYKKTVSRYRNAIADFHTEAADTIEQGNKLVYRFKTTGKRDNAPVMFEGVEILHIEGGKIVEEWSYLDASGSQLKLARAQSA